MGKQYYIRCGALTPYRVDVSLVENGTQADIFVNSGDQQAVQKDGFTLKRSLLVTNIIPGLDLLKEGGQNKKNAGNTMLLQYDNAEGINKTLILCDASKRGLEFELPDGDSVVKFYSAMDSEENSHPVIIGKRYVYSINDKLYYPLNIFVCKTPNEWAHVGDTISGRENDAFQPLIQKNKRKLKFKQVKL
jgi:hypothetical protein